MSNPKTSLSLYITSFVFNVYFFTVSFLCAFFGIFWLLGTRERAFKVPQVWEKLISFGASYIIGLTYRVEGAENLPAAPYLIGAKHQSAWETISFCGIFPKSVFIAKRELVFLPFLGFHFLKQKTIFVDRRLGSHTKENMVKQGLERVKDGDNILIYPEGTRRPVGAEPKYKKGIYHMYKALNVPVVPVAHNAGSYWPRRSFLKFPGEITVSILPPIEPGLDKESFMDRLENSIEAVMARIQPADFIP